MIFFFVFDMDLRVCNVCGILMVEKRETQKRFSAIPLADEMI